MDGSDTDANNTEGHGVDRVQSETGESSDNGDSEDDTDQIAVSNP
jgi:hypothetical protein